MNINLFDLLFFTCLGLIIYGIKYLGFTPVIVKLWDGRYAVRTFWFFGWYWARKYCRSSTEDVTDAAVENLEEAERIRKNYTAKYKIIK